LKRGDLVYDVVFKFKGAKNSGITESDLRRIRMFYKSEKGELTKLPIGKRIIQGRLERKYYPQKDILRECQDYYDILRPFVKECVKKFGRPTAAK